MDKNAPVIALHLSPNEAATLLRALPHIPISGEKAVLRQALDDLDNIEVKLRLALDTHIQAEMKAAKHKKKPGPILPDAPEGQPSNLLPEAVKGKAIDGVVKATRRRHGKK